MENWPGRLSPLPPSLSVLTSVSANRAHLVHLSICVLYLSYYFVAFLLKKNTQTTINRFLLPPPFSSGTREYSSFELEMSQIGFSMHLLEVRRYIVVQSVVLKPSLMDHLKIAEVLGLAT